MSGTHFSFRKVHSLTVHEDTPPNSIIYTISAEGPANIRYTFKDSCIFLGLHPVSGVLFTKQRITSESGNVNCTVSAQSSSNAEDTATLKIRVHF